MPRMQPEAFVAKRLDNVIGEFQRAWERTEASGLDTAKVLRTQYGSSYTTLGEVFAETAQQLNHLVDLVDGLRQEAEED